MLKNCLNCKFLNRLKHTKRYELHKMKTKLKWGKRGMEICGWHFPCCEKSLYLFLIQVFLSFKVFISIVRLHHCIDDNLFKICLKKEMLKFVGEHSDIQFRSVLILFPLSKSLGFNPIECL